MDSLIKDLVDRNERLARELGKSEGAMEVIGQQVKSIVAPAPEVIYRDAPAKPVSAEKKAALECIRLKLSECSGYADELTAYYGNAPEANLNVGHLKALLED